MKIRQATPINLYNSPDGKKCNYRAIESSHDSVTFRGAAYDKLMGSTEEKLAKGIAWLMQTKPAKKIVEATVDFAKRSDAKVQQKIKAGREIEQKSFIDDKLLTHLIVLGSTIMSGFYVIKTLQNKNMDEDKRKTLAINQGLVYVISTVMAYTFDIMLGKKTNQLKENFKKANMDLITNNPLLKNDKKKFDEAVKKLSKQENGIGTAKKIIVVDLIYRFIAPVIVTPLANYIGNRLQNKKEAELAFGNKK